MSTEALRAVATGNKERQKTIIDYLENKKVVDGLTAVATPYLNAQRMLRLSVNAVKKTPRLLECDPATVLGAFMTSTALGLEPNTIQQQAFLIPYKKRKQVDGKWQDVYECQFQIGYRGFVTLAYRSPLIKRVAFNAIHEGDRFEYGEGSESFLRYAVSLDKRGPLIGAFSWVLLTNGLETACVLPLIEVEKIRGRSETYRSLVDRVAAAKPEDRAKAEKNLAETPWVLWADDMAAKSAFKKHAKQLPIAQQDAILAAADVDSLGEVGQADLRSMVDPDLVKEVFEGTADVPQLQNDPSPDADFIAGMEQGEKIEREKAAGTGEQPAAKAAEAQPEPKK